MSHGDGFTDWKEITSKRPDSRGIKGCWYWNAVIHDHRWQLFIRPKGGKYHCWAGTEFLGVEKVLSDAMIRCETLTGLQNHELARRSGVPQPRSKK